MFERRRHYCTHDISCSEGMLLARFFGLAPREAMLVDQTHLAPLSAHRYDKEGHHLIYLEP
jgi:hypothetical protein